MLLLPLLRQCCHHVPAYLRFQLLVLLVVAAAAVPAAVVVL
jgi:hypothetical protein